MIPWRDEGDRGESLRYSLRSLRNLPHEGVVIVGDELPEWTTGVESVVLTRQSNRFEDGQANVLAGLEAVGSDWAYISHDDFVITRPVDWIKPSHRGPLAWYKRGRTGYYQRAHKITQWLERQGYEEPLNFNVHAPFLVNVDRYLKAASLVEHLPAGFRASVYGNIYELKVPQVFDPKVVSRGQTPNARWPVWSMSDTSFANGLVGRQVKNMFSDPGPYERLPSH